MSAIIKPTANANPQRDEAPYDMFQSLRQARRKVTTRKSTSLLSEKDDPDIAQMPDLDD